MISIIRDVLKTLFEDHALTLESKIDSKFIELGVNAKQKLFVYWHFVWLVVVPFVPFPPIKNLQLPRIHFAHRLWLLFQLHVHFNVLVFFRVELMSPFGYLFSINFNFLDFSIISIESMQGESENKHKNTESDPYFSSFLLFFVENHFRSLKFWLYLHKLFFREECLGFRYFSTDVAFFLKQDIRFIRFSTVSTIFLVFESLVLFSEVLDFSLEMFCLVFLSLSVIFGVVFVALFEVLMGSWSLLMLVGFEEFI